MKERGIAFETVEGVMLDPDEVVELAPGKIAYDKSFEKGQSLRVVIDAAAQQIVTVYFLDE